MVSRSKPNKPNAAAAKAAPFAVGEKVIVAGAGRDWPARVTSRQLPDGRQSIHPQYDDTAIFVTFDDTGVSMPVSIKQVSKTPR